MNQALAIKLILTTVRYGEATEASGTYRHEGHQSRNPRVCKVACWHVQDLANLWKQRETFDNRCSISLLNRSTLADAHRRTYSTLGMLGHWLHWRLLAMDLSWTVQGSNARNSGLLFGLIGIHWECSCSPSLIHSSASPATSHETLTRSVPRSRILDFGPLPSNLQNFGSKWASATSQEIAQTGDPSSINLSKQKAKKTNSGRVIARLTILLCSTSPWPPLLQHLGGRLDASLDPAHGEPQCGYQQMTAMTNSTWVYDTIMYVYLYIYICIYVPCSKDGMYGLWSEDNGNPSPKVGTPSILNWHRWFRKICWKHTAKVHQQCVCVCHNSNVSGIFSDILEQKQFEEGSFPHSKKAILTLAALAYFRCEGMHYFKLHLLHETCKASLALLTQWASHGGAAEVLHQLLELSTMSRQWVYLSLACQLGDPTGTTQTSTSTSWNARRSRERADSPECAYLYPPRCLVG